MIQNTGMKVTYIDPDQRVLHVAEMPNGRWGIFRQKGMDVAQKLISKGSIDPDGYIQEKDAASALQRYVSIARENCTFRSWDVFVNGKLFNWNDFCAMLRGDIAAPSALPPPALVTLANIEYRIGIHIQGAYENILDVGFCLNEAKDAGLVPHGEWEGWVRRNAHMSERYAQRLMQAARSVAHGSAMEHLPISKIQAILSLPESEREPMAEKVDSEDMSLRELQKQIRAQKERADNAERVKEEYQAAEAISKQKLALAKQQQQQAEKALENMNVENEAICQRLRQKIDELTLAPPESLAEIERLKEELAEAEEYAEEQAQQRQKAQREMLNYQSQAARGEVQGAAASLTVFDLAAAVRSFIGTAGVLPHMGATLCRANEHERQEVRQSIDMVATWVEGARQALGTISVDD